MDSSYGHWEPICHTGSIKFLMIPTSDIVYNASVIAVIKGNETEDTGRKSVVVTQRREQSFLICGTGRSIPEELVLGGWTGWQ